METPKYNWSRLVTINDNPQQLSVLTNKNLSHF